MRLSAAGMLGLALAFSTGCGNGPKPTPPNILFILTDDQSYLEVGAYGNPEVGTPHIDRLADRGVRFLRAYNMGSTSPAVCVPSRTMLNTGRFLWSAMALDQEDWHARGLFWTDRMRAAGYRTYMSGKWHVRRDVGSLFDVVRNPRPGMPDVFPDRTPEAYDRPFEGEEDPWSPWDERLGGYWEGGTHWSEVLASDALEFIEEASGRSEPFFMYLAFNAPHDPRQSPREYVEGYDAEALELPPSYLPRYPFAEAIGSGPDLRDERLAPFPRTEHAVRVHRRELYAIITHLDAQIGRILEALDRSGLADKTWVFLTSDHGLAVGRHGLMGKQNMYDHSLRVPLIVVGPEAEAGATIETPVYLQDVMPTTLDLAGAAGHEVDFRSLLPLIRRERAASYAAIYGAYLDLQRCVVEGRHKLVLYPAVGRMRLFDLESDPHEVRDLSENPEFRPVIGQLLRHLIELQAQMGDELDLAEAFPDWF